MQIAILKPILQRLIMVVTLGLLSWWEDQTLRARRYEHIKWGTRWLSPLRLTTCLAPRKLIPQITILIRLTITPQRPKESSILTELLILRMNMTTRFLLAR